VERTIYSLPSKNTVVLEMGTKTNELLVGTVRGLLLAGVLRVGSGVAGLLRAWPTWVILAGSPSSRSTSALAAPPGDDRSAPVRADADPLKLDADGLSLGAACRREEEDGCSGAGGTDAGVGICWEGTGSFTRMYGKMGTN
jgi:hypothetical protein